MSKIQNFTTFVLTLYWTFYHFETIHLNKRDKYSKFNTKADVTSQYLLKFQ